MIVIPLNERHQPADICGWWRDGRYHCELSVDYVDEDAGVTINLEVCGIRSPGCGTWAHDQTDAYAVTFKFQGREIEFADWHSDVGEVWNDDIRDAMESEYQKDRELERETAAGVR